MKFLYEYRTRDNVLKSGAINAPDREAAFAALKIQGIRPARMSDAPGVFNKLFGKGKRWMVIVILAISLLATLAVYLSALSKVTDLSARDSQLSVLDSTVRRQVIGDAAVIDEGIRTGWSSVFSKEGDRFLASFAIPGVPAGQRNTTEDEIRKVVDVDTDVAFSATDEVVSLEARQIIAMVKGMKEELREFLSDGGTIAEYGRELVLRQEREIGYYMRAKRELESAVKTQMPEGELAKLLRERNASLRKMGIKLVVLAE